MDLYVSSEHGIYNYPNVRDSMSSDGGYKYGVDGTGDEDRPRQERVGTELSEPSTWLQRLLKYSYTRIRQKTGTPPMLTRLCLYYVPVFILSVCFEMYFGFEIRSFSIWALSVVYIIEMGQLMGLTQDDIKHRIYSVVSFLWLTLFVLWIATAPVFASTAPIKGPYGIYTYTAFFSPMILTFGLVVHESAD